MDAARDPTQLDARIALHAHYSLNPLGFYRWLFDRLALAPGSRVLDIGCGSGRLWTDNTDRTPPQCEIVLADLAPGMVRSAAERLHADPHAFRFAVADLQALPFRGQTFDAVIASHMLYHVPDRPRAYAEIRRVLRPQGRLFCAAAFLAVALHRYDDALLVPDAEPLVAYAAAAGHLTGAAPLDRFRALVQARIARDGPLRIDKSAGVFEARVDGDPQTATAPWPRPCRVVAGYQQVYPDPITVQAGETVTLTGREDNWHGWIWIWGIDPRGKAGWMPRDSVAQHGDRAVARYAYDAHELTVEAGEAVVAERAESGWLWCVNAQGRRGWVPADHMACP